MLISPMTNSSALDIFLLPMITSHVPRLGALCVRSAHQIEASFCVSSRRSCSRCRRASAPPRSPPRCPPARIGADRDGLTRFEGSRTAAPTCAPAASSLERIGVRFLGRQERRERMNGPADSAIRFTDGSPDRRRCCPRPTRPRVSVGQAKYRAAEASTPTSCLPFVEPSCEVEIGLPARTTYIDFPDSDVSRAWTLYAWEPDR